MAKRFFKQRNILRLRKPFQKSVCVCVCVGGGGGGHVPQFLRHC